MTDKVLTSDVIGIDAFRDDPVTTLSVAEQGTVAVLVNNAPAFYAITPERLARLLMIEKAMSQTQSDVQLAESLFDDAFSPSPAISVPAGKFAMYAGWTPDADFLRLAAVWGVTLTAPVRPQELASFVAYWQAEGRMYHHVQWQQKLARNLQKTRTATGLQKKQDVNYCPDPDLTIPAGFRG